MRYKVSHINRHTLIDKHRSTQARHYAQAMHAPLVYTSSSHGVNVEKIFKIVLSKAFRLRCTIPVVTGEVHGEPICEY